MLQPTRPPCVNCGVTESPLWRRDPDGNTVCNACGELSLQVPLSYPVCCLCSPEPAWIWGGHRVHVSRAAAALRSASCLCLSVCLCFSDGITLHCGVEGGRVPLCVRGLPACLPAATSPAAWRRTRVPCDPGAAMRWRVCYGMVWSGMEVGGWVWIPISISAPRLRASEPTRVACPLRCDAMAVCGDATGVGLGGSATRQADSSPRAIAV